LSRRRKKRRRAGGWPRHAQPARIPPKKEKLPKGLEAPLALERAAREMVEGAPDVHEMERRFRRLRDLFATHRELSALRPDRRQLQAALHEFLKSHPHAPEAHEDEENRRRAAYACLIPRVFDDDLIERIQKTLTDALLEVKSAADADALVMGLLCAAEGKRADSPLLEMLLGLSIAELAHFEEAIWSLGIFPEPERLEAILRNPAELDSLARDPEVLRKLDRAFRKDPVLRREGVRAAEEAEELLYSAIADGTIRAHLTEEELRPVLVGLENLAERFCPEETETLEDEEGFRKAAAKLFYEYTESPANRPAFERFTSGLGEQAEQAVAQSSPAALKLKVLSDLWAGRWENDGYLRALLVSSSLRRVIREDQSGEQTGETPPP